MLQQVRSHMSYANISATIALFVAVGGTSYAAIALPENSVGERQIRQRAVGVDELQRGAVRSRAIRNGAVRLRDLAQTTRESLQGVPGPAGAPGAPAVSLRAAFNSAGGRVAGSDAAASPVAPNKLLVDFGRPMAACVPTATLARNSGGLTTDPGPGRIVVAIEGDRVAVETYTADGTPAFLPFNVIVAC